VRYTKLSHIIKYPELYFRVTRCLSDISSRTGTVTTFSYVVL